MSIELVCECGTVLHAPDSAAGREGRCRACGRRLRVPVPKRRTAEDEARELDPLYRKRPSLEDYAAVRQPARGFWTDAARTFVLDGKPTNLIPLIFTWFLLEVMFVLGFALVIGLLGRFLIAGWLCSFCMNIIRETAAGEDEIPTFRWEGGLWDDILAPFLSFLGSLFGVLLPAIVAWILTIYTGSEVMGRVATGLAVAGLAAWPAALLVVSIGGISAAFQLEAIALTIARSLLPYLAVVGLIAAAVGLYMWSGQHLLGGRGAAWAGFGAVALQNLVHAWAMIVSMRCIGLYYRHFKHRFPWAAE